MSVLIAVYTGVLKCKVYFIRCEQSVITGVFVEALQDIAGCRDAVGVTRKLKFASPVMNLNA